MGYGCEFFLGEIVDVQNLDAVSTQSASGDASSKECSDVRGFVAVRIIDDHVIAAVHTENPGDVNRQARLFPRFPGSRIGWFFPRFDDASRSDPDTLVFM